MIKTLSFRGRATSLATAAVLVVASLVPMLLNPQLVGATEEVTSRKVTIDKPGTTETDVEYKFDFTLPSGATDVEGIRILFCTTPQGTCTQPAPGSGAFTAASYTIDAQTFTGVVAFTAQATNTGDCTIATTVSYEVCVKRTDPTTETAVAKSLTISGINHTALTANSTIYARLALYDNATFTPGASNVNVKFNGVVAAAIVQTLTITARVQEDLQFCVGTTAINDGTTTPGAACANITGTTVDLGIVDTTTTGAVSPDAEGNNVNGIAMLRTNANGGTTIGYRAVSQAGTNHTTALRVPSSTCNAGNVNTDQCFRSFATQTVLAANTEQFGMTAEFVNVGSSATPTAAVTRNANYDGSAGGYAWQETNTSTEPVASASGATDDEALILKFAAVAAITTPTGAYQAQAKFIATPTF